MVIENQTGDTAVDTTHDHEDQDHHHGPNLITTGRSIPIGLLKSYLLGSPAAGLTYRLFEQFGASGNMTWAFTVLAGSLAAAALYKGMSDGSDGNVAVGNYGVHQVAGGLSGKVFGPGHHPLMQGLEKSISVSSQDKPVDPPAFQEIAKDGVPILMDGYFVVRIIDPVRHLVRIGTGDAIKALSKQFDAEMRLFAAQWKRGVDLVAQRELLRDYLHLTKDKSDPKYGALRKKLMELTVKLGEDHDPMLDETSVDNILADAGNFCECAARWGYVVEDIHTEGVDLPQTYKDAAAETAAAHKKMETYQIKQTKRLEMFKAARAEPAFKEMSSRDIMTGIDLVLELATKRDITEFNFVGFESTLRPLAGEFGKYVKELVVARRDANKGTN